MITILHVRDDGSFIISGPIGPYHVTPSDPLYLDCVKGAANGTFPPEPAPLDLNAEPTLAADLAASAYGSIRAALTPAERETLAVRLTSTGSANRALQGIRDDALAGLPVERPATLAAMVAAGVLTQTRADALA